MTTKRRTDYQVDEEALKRMMAGDVTALERTVPPEEEPETKSQAGPCSEKQEKKSGSSRQQSIAGHCTGNVCPHVFRKCTVRPSGKVSAYHQ